MMTRRNLTGTRTFAGLNLARNRGMTMLEVVIAISIILTIMVGVVWSFIELLDSHDKARARMDATANARSAMEVLSTEFKRAQNTTATLGVTFQGLTVSSAGGGDRFDDDGDGVVDEETFNGADDDAGWNVATDDRHILLPAGGQTYAERPVFYQHLDLDDADVDEDLGQTSATVEFSTYDVPGEPLDRHVRFYVGADADGTPNTLMREVSGIDPVTSTSVITSGPLCYNVQSFGLLFWNHAKAKNSSANPWEMEWPPAAPPLTITPSSVYLRVSVYAGKPYGLDEVPADQRLDVVTLTSMVNVEAVLADPTYIAQRTPVTPVAP